jgi:hypothetical protein
MPKFIKGSYETAGLAIIQEESEYYWGNDARNHPPFDGPFISILKRK